MSEHMTKYQFDRQIARRDRRIKELQIEVERWKKREQRNALHLQAFRQALLGMTGMDPFQYPLPPAD